MDRKLKEALDAARQRQMTKEEIEAQRVSFAFGNAPDGDCGTIETVRAASTIISSTTGTTTTGK